MIGIDINIRSLQLVAVSLALVMAGTEFVAVRAAPAPASAGAASPPKTVTWYANNRQARARVQLACLDDPGRLINNPDCVNAHEASVKVAIREGKLRNGEMDPKKLAFWSDDPAGRRNRLILCQHNPRVEHCDLARRSLLLEAGLK